MYCFQSTLLAMYLIYESYLKYIFLKEEKGHGTGVTCETLGYHSIYSPTECNEAAKSIEETSSIYGQTAHEIDCNPTNPNHCFVNTDSGGQLYFTSNSCPVHHGSAHPVEGLICKLPGIF